MANPYLHTTDPDVQYQDAFTPLLSDPDAEVRWNQRALGGHPRVGSTPAQRTGKVAGYRPGYGASNPLNRLEGDAGATSWEKTFGKLREHLPVDTNRSVVGTPSPIVAAPTVIPPPNPVTGQIESQYGTAAPIHSWQQTFLHDMPALGVDGSPENTEFVSAFKQYGNPEKALANTKTALESRKKMAASQNPDNYPL